MTIFPLRSPTAPDIRALIARLGAWPVFRHALCAPAGRGARPARPRAALPACPHLRRDIGLEPLPGPTPRPPPHVPWLGP